VKALDLIGREIPRPASHIFSRDLTAAARLGVFEALAVTLRAQIGQHRRIEGLVDMDEHFFQRASRVRYERFVSHDRGAREKPARSGRIPAHAGIASGRADRLSRANRLCQRMDIGLAVRDVGSQIGEGRLRPVSARRRRAGWGVERPSERRQAVKTSGMAGRTGEKPLATAWPAWTFVNVSSFRAFTDRIVAPYKEAASREWRAWGSPTVIRVNWAPVHKCNLRLNAPVQLLRGSPIQRDGAFSGRPNLVAPLPGMTTLNTDVARTAAIGGRLIPLTQVTPYSRYRSPRGLPVAPDAQITFAGYLRTTARIGRR